MSQLRKSVFHIDIPWDIEEPAERVRLAFLAVEEAADDFVIPCS
jgi:hypothetical protein